MATGLLPGLLLLTVAGCDFLWPLDSPHDQRRCDPGCTGGEVCEDGQCEVPQVGGDAAERDTGPQEDGAKPDLPLKKDGPKQDKPQADKPKADKLKADKPKLDKPQADKPNPCGPTTCSGCCEGGVCKMASSNAACGKGGVQCVACKKYQSCMADVCKLNTGSQWGVTVVKADIDKSKAWDPAPNVAPDVYVEVAVGAVSGKTTVKNNTYTPYWNELVLTATAKDIMTHGLAIKVHDDDWPKTQLIASCKVTVAEKVLVGGIGYLTCGQDVKNFKILFSAK